MDLNVFAPHGEILRPQVSPGLYHGERLCGRKIPLVLWLEVDLQQHHASWDNVAISVYFDNV